MSRHHRTAPLLALQALCMSSALPAMTARQEQVVDYQEGQIVPLRIVEGRQVTVRFSQKETVRDIAVPDGDAWRVTKNRSGDQVLVQSLRAGGAGYMSVTTDSRRYTFGLSVAPASSIRSTPTVVTLRSPIRTTPSGTAATGTAQSLYRIRGDRALYPMNVSTDGARTYVDWAPDAPLPAVYAIDAAGRETLVNGNMREGRYVIDSVETHLVFRIDKRVATAVFTNAGARR